MIQLEIHPDDSTLILVPTSYIRYIQPHFTIYYRGSSRKPFLYSIAAKINNLLRRFCALPNKSNIWPKVRSTSSILLPPLVSLATYHCDLASILCHQHMIWLLNYYLPPCLEQGHLFLNHQKNIHKCKFGDFSLITEGITEQ